MFLVTSLPSAGAGIRTPQMAIFELLEEAKAEAERLLRIGSQEVMIWEQTATPTLIQTVNWG